MNRQGTLTGDVFIVTKAAQNVKLGLVEVRALRYDEAQDAVKRARDLASGEIAKLQPGLDAARKAVELAGTGDAITDDFAKQKADMTERIVAALDAARATVDERHGLQHRPDPLVTAKDRIAATRSASEYLLANDRMGQDLARKRDALAVLEREVRKWKSGAFYFEHLPSS
ncbi:MAG: hypothetical protein ACRD3J_27305, partial [Thermoanaerobaculia bacterium]